ncbi:MAG: hypothetical protein HOP18_01410 [Deltaproteobacteria bacterium]|nr:hypothetical protein [Deltaproteobacteria bacterium]
MITANPPLHVVQHASPDASARDSAAPVASSVTTPDVGFVACIEKGVLEAQALLLFQSIRRYTGVFQDCALYGLSPRAGHAISPTTRKRLDALGVQYLDTVLNSECLEYGPANRVAAAAHIEETHPHEILVILDSDTLFLREPREFLLASDTDVAVRPVDVKGAGTNGSQDRFDTYWQALCRCCGVDYEDIPWRASFVDHHRIKASYNGGLVVARGDLGIMRKWATFFFQSVRQGLRPRLHSASFRSGAGWVNSEAGGLWGSNQAALSLAVWSTSQRVQQLPPVYNYLNFTNFYTLRH